MTIENVELMHECCPQRLRMGTARTEDGQQSKEKTIRSHLNFILTRASHHGSHRGLVVKVECQYPILSLILKCCIPSEWIVN